MNDDCDFFIQSILKQDLCNQFVFVLYCPEMLKLMDSVLFISLRGQSQV